MVDLLFRRMLASQLNKDEIARLEPATLRTLQMLCASCGNREECELGLADDFADVAWEVYCPNAATLRALGELPWFQNGELGLKPI